MSEYLVEAIMQALVKTTIKDSARDFGSDMLMAPSSSINAGILKKQNNQYHLHYIEFFQKL